MSDIEQRLREAMDGVTPGPWELVSLSGYGSPFSIRMAYTSSSPNAPKTHYGVQSVRTRADAVYIALCSPDNIGALLDTIASLRSKLEEAEGALEPFATLLAALAHTPDSTEVAALPSAKVDQLLSLKVGDLRRARRTLASLREADHA